MRLVPIHLCQPGMRLAKKIFSDDGLVLLGQHVELTSQLIRRLGDYGVSYVYIEDALTADVVIPELISEEARLQAVSEIKSSFREIIEMPKVSKGVTYPYVAKRFRKIMTMIMDEIGNQPDTMIMLMDMGVVDHYLYQHSLNVCIYTTLLGISNGYSKDEVMTLGLGSLLHDIGKTQISTQVLMKPGKLTAEEYAEMKRHTQRGYELLKDEANIPLLVAHCAFQHHERIDGSGYPRGLKGDRIHEYAKWIGIVDSYDAMTTSRVYRAPMLPHQAIEALYVGSGSLYEQRMVQLFRDKIVIYPVGILVKLSSGVLGVVVHVHAACPHRPVVRVLYNEVGEVIALPYEVDLAKELTTMIVSVNEYQTLSTALQAKQ